MAEPRPTNAEPTKAPSSVTFYFEKTSNFQTMHADGAIGSITPAGEAFIAFYVERAPIPKTLVFPIGADGTMKTEPSTVTGKQGVFREIHSAVVLSANALQALKKHIDTLLIQIENASKRTS